MIDHKYFFAFIPSFSFIKLFLFCLCFLKFLILSKRHFFSYEQPISLLLPAAEAFLLRQLPCILASSASRIIFVFSGLYTVSATTRSLRNNDLSTSVTSWCGFIPIIVAFTRISHALIASSSFALSSRSSTVTTHSGTFQLIWPLFLLLFRRIYL